jgi:hypothetical protein
VGLGDLKVEEEEEEVFTAEAQRTRRKHEKRQEDVGNAATAF